MGAAHSSPEICWAISGIPMASFNATIRLKAGPYSDDQIDEIQQIFAERVMPFVWWVSDVDAGNGLEPQLRQHIASLTASGSGARLYEAIGFKEYCRFREYVWRP